MTAPPAPRLLLAFLPYRPRAFAPSFEQGGLALRLLFGIGRKGPLSGATLRMLSGRIFWLRSRSYSS